MYYPLIYCPFSNRYYVLGPDYHNNFYPVNNQRNYLQNIKYQQINI